MYTHIIIITYIPVYTLSQALGNWALFKFEDLAFSLLAILLLHELHMNFSTAITIINR